MTLLSAWALAGLLLLVPLVALHLRRDRPPLRDVSSLIGWRELGGRTSSPRRRFGPPILPLLLILQAAALVLLVVALARPASSAPAASGGPVYVLDDSAWMGASEEDGTRIEAARDLLRRQLGDLPAESRVDLVLAGRSPSLAYSGDPQGALDFLDRVEPGRGPADLGAALRLAVGVRERPGDPIVLVRAPENAAPRVANAAGVFTDSVVGAPADDLALTDSVARCGLHEPTPCEVLARVRNTGDEPADTRVTALSGGRVAAARTVRVRAHGSAAVAFDAPPGARLELRLAGGDGLAADDRAWVAVPATDRVRITLVADPASALPLARALAAAPGARLRLRDPADYSADEVRASDLLVLEGWVPDGGLPAAPAVLLVDPPRLPDGVVDGTLADPRLSATDPSSPILAGVDLTALAIEADRARRLTLPAALAPVASSPDGPLLAAGSTGGQRVAVLAFDPAHSTLPQLAALPILISNLIGFSQEWVASEAVAGEPLAIDQPPGWETTVTRLGGAADPVPAGEGGLATVELDRPGIYEVVQTAGIERRERIVAVNLDLAAAEPGPPVDLALPPASGGAEPEPLWRWVLGLALFVLLAEWVYAARHRRSAAASVLGLVALGLLVAALVGPEIGPSSPDPTVVLADRSASLDQGAREVEREWLRTWEEGAEEEDGEESAHGAIAFAGGPELTSPEAALGGDAPAPDPAGTDLAAALRLALGALPSDGGRVVVLSDGFETTGDAAALAASARARGVEIDAVPLASTRPDAAIARLVAPPALHAGDALPLQVTVRSTVAGSAELSLRRDGRSPRRQNVALEPGDNPLLLTPRAPAAGSHSYEVRVRLDGDEVPVNDALDAAIRVAPQPRIVVVSTGGSPLAGVLRGDGMRVREVTPGALPTTSRGYRRDDAVILDDVPAPAIGDARSAALTEAVRTDGLGLLAFGGEHSFSLGRYAGSRLQEALPVASRRPGKRQRRNLALEVILDRSDSMSESAGGVPRIRLAQEAARVATAFAAEHRDELGIVSFDIRPRTLVPLATVTPGARAQAVDARIDGLVPDGGTNIYLALRAALRQIEGSRKRDRHMILLSDGVSERADYAPLLERLESERITVSTVALGAEADTRLLRAIARRTDGRFEATRDGADLPEIFARDIRRAARPVRVRGRIPVTPGLGSPIVRSLGDRALPPLRGNVVTRLRPGAQADLLGENEGHPRDPVLAHWQYGLGRVVAWIPGLAPATAGEWARESVLWLDATRWALRGVGIPALTPSVSAREPRTVEVDPVATAGAEIDLARLEGSLLSAAGAERSLRFSQTAPSAYEAPIRGLPAGAYGYAIAATRPAARARGVIALPYPEEYRPRPGGESPLGPLAAATGGRILDPGDPDAIGGPTELWWWLALAALAFFLAAVAVRMLPARAGPERRPDVNGGAQARTISPVRAASNSRSTGSTPVGARR